MKFTIKVEPRTKKNSMRVFQRNGRTIVIPSKAYEDFENQCLMQIYNSKNKPINFPVNIKAIFYMKTKRKVDLTNLLEAVDDMLVQAKIIEDDNRNILASHDGSLVLYDKENPRIEIEIIKKEGYTQWKNTKS